jgi:hypothetical protein
MRPYAAVRDSSTRRSISRNHTQYSTVAIVYRTMIVMKLTAGKRCGRVSAASAAGRRGGTKDLGGILIGHPARSIGATARRAPS